MLTPSTTAKKLRRKLLPCGLIVCFGMTAQAQQVERPPSPKSQDEVVKVFTELVQTDVMVFDKDGRFVKGLNKENFELRIDGGIRPIQSFEQISAGSNEEAQLAAARGSSTSGSLRPVPLDRGRTVFFYVDDFHLDHAGFTAAKKVISNFLEKEMGQNDQAAISSATGQIGFLQQLTDNRVVLKAALERLSPRSYGVRDFDRPALSEYESLLIDRNDTDVLDFFISETVRLNPGIPRDTAAGMVRSRAQQILAQAGAFNTNTLIGLERLVKSAKQLPGRKVVFFLSNGFLIENRRSDSISKLRDVTDAAAQSGVVIYSLDTRGLVATLEDISVDRPFDPSGRLESATHGELAATQDGMHALAVDTGGRAIFNTNDLTQGLAPALKETSTYYLLAWKPEKEQQKQARFRKIEVKVIGRPDLTVRVRRGFFDVGPTSPATSEAAKAPEQPETPATRLRKEILAAYGKTDLPVSLGLNYYDVATKGATISASVQFPGEFLMFGSRDGKIQAVVDVTGVFYNDRGQPNATFSERLVTTAPSIEATKEFQRDITYTYPVNLAPGLYQVRVAARDDKSGRIGSAREWITVPDLSQKKVAMSSLMLGENNQRAVASVSSTTAGSEITISASHRFRRDSTLRLLLFAYNASLSAMDQKPDLAVQIQVIRDDQPVITTSLRKINAEGVVDLARVPYAADILLSDLLPGRYLLQVSIIDRIAKQSATEQTHFDVY